MTDCVTGRSAHGAAILGLDEDGLPADAKIRSTMRALSQRGAHIQSSGAAAGFVMACKSTDLPPSPIDGTLVTWLKSQGWLTAPEADRMVLSATGRAVARRLPPELRSSSIAKSADADRRLGSAPMVDPDSPLAWLRRRRGRDGQPMLSTEAYQAGERLRADFYRGLMAPRVTAQLTALPSSGRRGAPGRGIELGEGTSAAQERVRRALSAVGPRLADVLIDVCCHMKGLEDTERARGMPQRAGHYVLGLALDALARHYGLLPPIDAGWPVNRRTRHWGEEGYRPGIDGVC